MAEGIKTFPHYFHEYYVIGLIESGKRHLSCKKREYVLNPGNIVIFHPGDNHTSTQIGGEPFDYRGFHISKPVMLDLAVLFDPHEKDRRLWVWDDPDDAQDILLWNPVYDPGAVFSLSIWTWGGL